MNFSTYRFTLDLQKHQSQMSIAAFQYDTAIKLSIGLTDGGVPYYLEDGCIAVLWGTKANGEPIAHTCSIEGNTRIIYEFNRETANEIGVVDCQIRLYKDGEEKISAPKFIIVVGERVVNDADVFNSGDGAFEEQFSALDDILTKESGRVIAENARVEAEKERAGNELLRKAEEDTRNTFENQRQTEEAKRVKAETEREKGYAQIDAKIADKADKTFVEEAIIPVSQKQDSLEKRVTDLESLTLTYTEDGSTAYEKSVPTNIGKYALIKGIGGATEKVSKSKNILNPKEMVNVVDEGGQGDYAEDWGDLSFNADGSISYNEFSADTYIHCLLYGLPFGKYFLYVEGTSNPKLESFEEEGGLTYIKANTTGVAGTQTIKVMLWRDDTDTSVTDHYEVVEAPEGTVFEPYSDEYELINADVERIESIGADGVTSLDTFVIPEAVRNLDGYGVGIDSTYCNSIEIVDGKVGFIKRCEKIVLNGSEAWSNTGIGTDKAYFFIKVGEYGDVVPLKIISDVYPTVTISSSQTNAGIYITNSTSGEARLLIRPENVKGISATNFAKLMKQNPVTAVYALSNPEVEDITHLFTKAEIKLLIEQGGSIRFVNKDKMPVPSSVWYTKIKE